MNEKKANLIIHLEELRRRIIISLAALFLGMTFCFIFGQELIFQILLAPLEKLKQELVLISVTEGFLIQIKTAFLGGLLLALPVILWQGIAFILPALYKKERRIFWPLFISSVLLFGLGIIFAYQCVLNLALQFLLQNFNAGLTPMLSAARYISFVITFLLPFGFVFEIPVAAFILTKSGLINPTQLRVARRYVIVGIFIIAAILTPPDIVSQVLLALPMLLLYEISIIVATLIYKF
jgi:sec-independent protein translocase protein TatC